MTTIEELVSITVLSGTSSAVVKPTLPAGCIETIVAHFDDKNNPGSVRTYMKNTGGQDVYKLQNINALRSREVENSKDGKRINLESKNSVVEIGIICDQNNTADTTYDFLFTYKLPETY